MVADAADYAETVCTAITSDIDIISSFFLACRCKYSSLSKCMRG